ncbi:MAG TPA: penicillin-binding protein 1A, partial [Arenimonas sp.]|nr:penicillin-binding protein 1A [Arenimonas sp.]
LAIGTYLYLAPKLPDVQELRDIKLQVPLSVYTKDQKLIAQFGETRRYPVDIKNVPLQVKQAFIASEDARFYEHKGLDYKGIGRAIWLTLTTSDKRVPGGSTITQQVARNYFELNRDVDYSRKVKEMLLALKMERELGKDEILGLYLNKIFFGHRSYGISAAAEFYYGKKLEELSLAETATLASLPKFPSSGNPIVNPKRAMERRGYVLRQMLEEGYITRAQLDAANAAPNTASKHEPKVEMNAPYLAEMVRREMLDRYGEEALVSGFKVYTTVASIDQINAEKAVRAGLIEYDHRHGWRGAESHIELPANADSTVFIEKARSVPMIGDFPAAIVTGFSGSDANLVLFNGTEYLLSGAASKWTGRSPASLLKRGDIVRLLPDEKSKGYLLSQLPSAQAALVSLQPEDGALRAIVGGFSFNQNSFNRAIQATRQPGSAFKPFVYAAAFERGYTPASIVNDAPVEFKYGNGKVWRPQNDGGRFAGPIRVREALVQSRNLVSVRLLSAIGTDFARTYITQFGFNKEQLPPNLSMSLGTASLTPMSIARGYTVFANGGFLVAPYFIEKIIDRDGNAVALTRPLVACRACSQRTSMDQRTATVVDGFDFSAGGPKKENAAPATKTDDPNFVGPQELALAPRAIDERTAFLLSSMMRDVVKRGTATAAKVLNREDIGGKTGSTNDHRDAWFSGFGGNLVTTVWVGKDNFKPLGYGEYGGRAALPIWINYMGAALKDIPITDQTPPNGVVTASISASGNLLPEGTPGALTEYFKQEDYDRLISSGYNWEVPGGDKTDFEDIF